MMVQTNRIILALHSPWAMVYSSEGVSCCFVFVLGARSIGLQRLTGKDGRFEQF